MALRVPDSTATFRICIIEDSPLSQKFAERIVLHKFKSGGYEKVFNLVVDSPTCYRELIEVHFERIKSGYYQVVIVDNDLALFPDGRECEGRLTGVQLIASIVKEVTLSTYFILNSSNNSDHVQENPNLSQIFPCIPLGGKNHPEAFERLDALYLEEALKVQPDFEKASGKQSISPRNEEGESGEFHSTIASGFNFQGPFSMNSHAGAEPEHVDK
jgi:hypothetical protein